MKQQTLTTIIAQIGLVIGLLFAGVLIWSLIR